MSFIDTILLPHLFGEKAISVTKSQQKTIKKPKKQKAKSQQKLFLAFCQPCAYQDITFSIR